MTDEKLLSIIVPSYNMEAYLPKCLGSLVIDDKQLLRKLDVIVVNDGSKDRTSEIAHEFEAKYPRVFRVIDKPNGHYGSCVNRGLSEAKGAFIKILDADDTFDADALKSFIQDLGKISEDKGGEEVDLVISDFQIVDVHGNPLGELHSFPYPKRKMFGVDVIAKNDNLWYRMHAVTYRTECLRRMRYSQVEGVMYSDTEWTIVPLCTVRKVRYIPIRLYLYLVGREGQSMAADVWNKSFQHRTKVLLHIAKSVAEQAEYTTDSNKILVDSFVFEGLKNIYTAGFLNCNVNEIKTTLRDLDADIASLHTNVYSRLRDVAFPRRYGFRLIRFWQDHKWSDRIVALYLKSYSRLVKLVLWFSPK